MPSSQILYRDLTSQEPWTVCTPRGNAIIEIQGELVLPDTIPDDLTDRENEKFIKIDSTVFSTGGDISAIRFGSLEIEGKKATLFIGNSQRLIGDLKEVKPPLALFKMSIDSNEKFEITDVIKYKIIFTGRPLPIM